MTLGMGFTGPASILKLGTYICGLCIDCDESESNNNCINATTTLSNMGWEASLIQMGVVVAYECNMDFKCYHIATIDYARHLV